MWRFGGRHLLSARWGPATGERVSPKSTQSCHSRSVSRSRHLTPDSGDALTHTQNTQLRVAAVLIAARAGFTRIDRLPQLKHLIVSEIVPAIQVPSGPFPVKSSGGIPPLKPELVREKDTSFPMTRMSTWSGATSA